MSYLIQTMYKRLVLFLLIIIPIILLVTYYLYPEKKLPNKFNTTKIIVYKSKSKMYLFSNDKLGKIYTISMGNNPKGHKHFKGDEKTPEGKYVIDYKNNHSMAYLSIHISYPNEIDKEYAANYNKNPGGDIMIHGLPNSIKCVGKFHRLINWTNGCIGITNNEMDEIWRSVSVGTIIEIKP